MWFGELPNGVEEWIGRPMPNFEQVFHEALVRHSVGAHNGLKSFLILNPTGCLFSVCLYPTRLLQPNLLLEDLSIGHFLSLEYKAAEYFRENVAGWK